MYYFKCVKQFLSYSAKIRKIIVKNAPVSVLFQLMIELDPWSILSWKKYIFKHLKCIFKLKKLKILYLYIYVFKWFLIIQLLKTYRKEQNCVKCIRCNRMDLRFSYLCVNTKREKLRWHKAVLLTSPFS